VLIPPEQVHKILLISIAHIGDIVLSCPTARALKLFFPQADIDMLVSTPQGEAAYHNPYISKVIFYDIKDWQLDRAKLMTLIQLLRQTKYDVAFSSRYGSADPMLAWLSGAVCRVGFDVHGGGQFLTHLVPAIPPVIRHETDNQLEVLSALGITAADTRIEFLVSAAEEAGVRDKLPHLGKSGQPLILLCPFSEHPQKNWTNSGYINILQELAKFADCCLIGTYSQQPALNAINIYAGNVATVLGGTLSLGELGALIKQADLLITVDTGPMHIAQAFQTPVIALMGPTDPKIWGPRRACDIILYKPMHCSPCWHKDDAVKNSCRQNECMRRIRPAEVIQAAKAILAASPLI